MLTLIKTLILDISFEPRKHKGSRNMATGISVIFVVFIFKNPTFPIRLSVPEWHNINYYGNVSN